MPESSFFGQNFGGNLLQMLLDVQRLKVLKQGVAEKEAENTAMGSLRTMFEQGEVPMTETDPTGLTQAGTWALLHGAPDVGTRMLGAGATGASTAQTAQARKDALKIREQEMQRKVAEDRMELVRGQAQRTLDLLKAGQVDQANAARGAMPELTELFPKEFSAKPNILPTKFGKLFLNPDTGDYESLAPAMAKDAQGRPYSIEVKDGQIVVAGTEGGPKPFAPKDPTTMFQGAYAKIYQDLLDSGVPDEKARAEAGGKAAEQMQSWHKALRLATSGAGAGKRPRAFEETTKFIAGVLNIPLTDALILQLQRKGISKEDFLVQAAMKVRTNPLFSEGPASKAMETLEKAYDEINASSPLSKKGQGAAPAAPKKGTKPLTLDVAQKYLADAAKQLGKPKNSPEVQALGKKLAAEAGYKVE